jgi:sodium-dependent dicarboxylate transporter 2/3/5
MAKAFFKNPNRKKLLLALFALLICLATFFMLPTEFPEPAGRVVTIILFAIFFWGFEIIPLYATALLVVIGLTLFLQADQGFEAFLLPFSNPVIFLFLGGLTLAVAAHKHDVDRFLMEKMLAKVGHSTKALIWGILLITAFFSMWISNTASAAMMLLLVKPLMDKLDADDPLSKAVALAIVFGANLGGIGTPIGTPPNAIAIGILAEEGTLFTFLSWVIMTLPLMLILLALAAGVIFYFFRPKTSAIDLPLPDQKPLSKRGIAVIAIILLIIALWLTKSLHHIPEEIVALIGVGIFTASRLIGVKDFRTIQWDILILIWGGLALGEGVQKSGLINEIVKFPLFSHHEYLLITAFCILAILLTSFISNTATANLILPLAISIAPASSSFLSITIALSCSLALFLPISTPPNAIVYGSGAITTRDMMKAGGVLSALCLIPILLGFKFVIPLILRFLI